MSDTWEGIKLPNRFVLKKDDVIVASLNLCQTVEMFWFGCEFSPTEAFADIPKVDWETKGIDSGRASYDGTSSTCTLFEPDNAVVYGAWIMHCISENEVHIRFAEPMRQRSE